VWRKKKQWQDEDDLWYAFDEEETGYRSSTPRRFWVIGLVVIAIVVLSFFVLWRIFEGREALTSVTKVDTLLLQPTNLSATVVPTPSPFANSPSRTVGGTDTSSTPPTVEPLSSNYIPEALAQQMLVLINEARTNNGLGTVVWDDTASLAGQYHTEEMVQFSFFSHWNRGGLGLDHRYTQVGGQHAVMENLHAFSYTYDNGQGAPIEDWMIVIEDAHTGLMNSPGHRANILDPAHTHVGIGMAYNPETGQFRLAQEFTNQYVRLTQPLPLQVVAGTSVVVQGVFNGGELSRPLLSLAYEPFPAPLSIEALNQTGSYRSAAATLETISIDLNFDESITLGESGQPGFYHIRLFVDVSGQQALVVNHVVTVR